MANKDEVLIMRIDPKLKATLSAAAKDNGLSMSEVVRRLITSIPVDGKIEGERVIWKEEA